MAAGGMGGGRVAAWLLLLAVLVAASWAVVAVIAFGVYELVGWLA